MLKKLLSNTLGMVIVGLLIVGATAFAQSSALRSFQVGSAPVNGYVLQTSGNGNSAISAWVSTTTLGITSGTGGGSSLWATSSLDSTLISPAGALKIAIGTTTSATEFNLVGNMTLGSTTKGSLQGIIYKDSDTFLHDAKATSTSGFNTFLGVKAGNLTLRRISSGQDASFNTGIGYTALNALTSGNSNTMLGYTAGKSITTGVGNTAVGTGAMINNTASPDNTAVGFNSMASSLLGSVGSNSGFGFETLFNNIDGYQNTALGADVLYNNSSGARNTGVGYKALYNNTIGFYNAAVGESALTSNSQGERNAALGWSALQRVTTGTQNIGIGNSAGSWQTTGNYNIYIGSQAGSSGLSITGSSNTVVGTLSGLNLNGASSNNVLLGFSAGKFETGSDTFYLDDRVRANLAGDRAGALFYGNFNDDPTLQTLVVNASTTISSLGTGNVCAAGGQLYTTGCTGGGGGGLTSYDAWTHPLLGLSASTSQFIFGTSTAGNYGLTIATSTAPQLALSDTGDIAQWVFRNAGGNLYIATTSIDGTSTTSPARITILGSSGRIGIGTSTPSAPLTVWGNATAGFIHVGNFGANALGVGPLPFASLFSGTVGISTSSPTISNLTVNASSGTQNIALANGAGQPQWTLTNNGGNFYVSTTTLAGTATSTPPAFTILTSNGNVGIASSSPTYNLSVEGTLRVHGNHVVFGSAEPLAPCSASSPDCIEMWGNDNTIGGVTVGVGNINSGTSAYNGYFLNNNLADATVTHFGFLGQNSSTYSDTTFGTALAVPNLVFLQNTDAGLSFLSSSSTLSKSYINFFTGGTALSNERMRITGGGSVGIGTTTPPATLTVGTTTFPMAANSPLVLLGTSTLSAPSANGTYLALNAPASFGGNFFDIQRNGTAIFTLSPSFASFGGTISANTNFIQASGNANTAFTLDNAGGWTTTNAGSGIVLRGTKSGNPITTTANTVNNVLVTANGVNVFQPSSGNSQFNMFSVGDGTNLAILQTGSASGITRGIYLNPVLAKANDFRGLEIAPYTLNLALSTTSLATAVINPTSYASTTATTLTNAVGLYIPNPPIANQNVTISTSTALLIGTSLPTFTSASSTVFGGTVTNAYGLQVFAPNGATNNYAASFLNGSVGIGTTTPWRTLSVTGTGAWSGLTAAAGTPNSLCINSVTHEITENAALTCTVSDEEQKTKLLPLNFSALDLVNQLSPAQFAYLDNPSRLRYGFGAQTLQKVNPQLADGYDKNGIARSIDLPALIAINTKAIQELSQKVGYSVNVGRSMEENWQDFLIAVLIVGFLYQQSQIRRLKNRA